MKTTQATQAEARAIAKLRRIKQAQKRLADMADTIASSLKNEGDRQILLDERKLATIETSERASYTVKACQVQKLTLH